MVDLASAAAGLRSSGFTGFGPGASVCLPDSCDPCEPSSEFDDVVEVEDGMNAAALHERTAEEQSGVEFEGEDDWQQASALDLLADEHGEVQGRVSSSRRSLLHMVGLQ